MHLMFLMYIEISKAVTLSVCQSGIYVNSLALIAVGGLVCNTFRYGKIADLCVSANAQNLRNVR